MKNYERFFGHFCWGIFPIGCKSYNDGGELVEAGRDLVNNVLGLEKNNKKPLPVCNYCSDYEECEFKGKFRLRKNRLETENLEIRPFTSQQTVKIMLAIDSTFIMDDTQEWLFDYKSEFQTINILEATIPHVKATFRYLQQDLEDCPVFNDSIKRSRGVEVTYPEIIKTMRKIILENNLKIKLTYLSYFLLFIHAAEEDLETSIFILHKCGNYFERIEAHTRNKSDWLVNSAVVLGGLFPFGFPEKTQVKQWAKENKIMNFPADWQRK